MCEQDGARRALLKRIASGRTELVWDVSAPRHAAASVTCEGVRIVQWCAYYGDVSAIRFLLGRGESPTSPGENLGLNDAAFGTEATVGQLLCAGAAREVKDANGDTPLAWASWYGRPDAVLRRLCYGQFSVHPDRVPMREALLGRPRESA